MDDGFISATVACWANARRVAFECAYTSVRLSVPYTTGCSCVPVGAGAGSPPLDSASGAGPQAAREREHSIAPNSVRRAWVETRCIENHSVSGVIEPPARRTGDRYMLPLPVNIRNT